MILLIDNYDSFTFNLYQFIGKFNQDILVKRNDAITMEDIEALNPSHIVLSPGPKTPADAGVCIDTVKYFYKKIPILGVCLGHQSIGEAFGYPVQHAAKLFHGKTSKIKVEKDPLFAGIPEEIEVARYHSLVVQSKGIEKDFIILSELEGELMAIRHKEYPLYGIQFHPESIMTEYGDQIIGNFLEILKESINQKGAVS